MAIFWTTRSVDWARKRAGIMVINATGNIGSALRPVDRLVR